ncbi:MAG: hypothetical protein ACOC95_05470 [Planctomycetota bacterium]
MTKNDEQTVERFLDWVLAEHGREVRDACKRRLEHEPDADLFVVLDHVRARLHDGRPHNFSGMRYGF